MPMSLHTSTVPVFEQLLAALDVILDKAAAYAAARKIDPPVLLASRLRPDMLPLVSQIQIACDNAKNITARLAGVQAPRFEDNEATLDELKARIQKTLQYIRSVSAAEIDAGADRDVVFPLGPNKMKMKGADYAFHFALPNFFFHLTTAYDILRYGGVEIGKRDYMGAVQGISPA
jgi:hypothetical protein